MSPLSLPVPVVFPIHFCLADVLLLALLRATRKQNDEAAAVTPEVNAVSGAKVNPVFENTVANRLGVGQVAIRNPLKRGCYFRRGMNVECAQPLREGASTSGIDVLPNVEHGSMITYTLALPPDSATHERQKRPIAHPNWLPNPCGRRTVDHGRSGAGGDDHGFSQHDFPVMHGGQVLRLLTRAALLRAMMTEGPDAYVASAMDRNPLRVSPDTPLSEVLQDISGMRACALVMDGEKLVGLLASEDVSSFILLRQVSMQQQAKAQSRYAIGYGRMDASSHSRIQPRGRTYADFRGYHGKPPARRPVQPVEGEPTVTAPAHRPARITPVRNRAPITDNPQPTTHHL